MMVSIVKCNACGAKFNITYEQGYAIESFECPVCHKQGATISWANDVKWVKV